MAAETLVGSVHAMYFTRHTYPEPQKTHIRMILKHDLWKFGDQLLHLMHSLVLTH